MQHDPDRDTITDLQGSITATLTYIMGRASLAELFGLQGYLSQLASRMTDVGGGDERYALRQEMPAVLSQQNLMRAIQEQGNWTPNQYRQEG